jgi:CubicO group peptidase (beta-lactamase class C family)
VACKDSILDVETVGFADIAAKKAIRADALFWIASMSKPITATALMMLVDEGKVNPDDPVEKYLPEFQDEWLTVERDKEHMLLRRPRHPITVRNILTHTSGLAATSAMEKPTLDLLRLRDAVIRLVGAEAGGGGRAERRELITRRCGWIRGSSWS